MKKLLSLGLLVAFLCSLTFAAEGQTATDRTKNDQTKESKVTDRVQAAAEVLDQIQGTPDKGIPSGGLGIGRMRRGSALLVEGRLYRGSEIRARIGQLPHTERLERSRIFRGDRWQCGFQIGGQAVDLVMLVMNNDGMQHLLSSKFALGADASVAAGPVGRHAEGNTDWKMRAQGADLLAGAWNFCRRKLETERWSSRIRTARGNFTDAWCRSVHR